MLISGEGGCTQAVACCGLVRPHTSDDNDQDGLLQVLRLDALRHKRPYDLGVQLCAQRLRTHNDGPSVGNLEQCFAPRQHVVADCFILLLVQPSTHCSLRSSHREAVELHLLHQVGGGHRVADAVALHIAVLHTAVVKDDEGPATLHDDLLARKIS